MDFGFSGAGVSTLVNFVGVPPNLKVVSLLSLGSSSSVSFSSGSLRVDRGLIDLFSSFSASAALAATLAAAAAASFVCAAGLIGVSAEVVVA